MFLFKKKIELLYYYYYKKIYCHYMFRFDPNYVIIISLLSIMYISSAGAEDGIEEIRSSNMILKCYQTRTGIKFIITAEPITALMIDLEIVLKEIYVLYTECVLKDPFYELEMPIRSELFITAVDNLIDKVERIALMNTNQSTLAAMKLIR